MSIPQHSIPASIMAALALAMFVIACGGSQAEPPATQAPQPPATIAATEPPPATVAATKAPPAATATNPPPATAASAAPMATQPVQATATPTEPPTVRPTAQPVASAAATVFTLSEETVARYRVEEELANTGFFVAVGETQDVAGSIAFDADGAVLPDESRIVVQAATLRTDSNRRDGYVRNRTLETDTYPEIVFQPTAVEGLTWPLTRNFPVAFTIIGDLTIKDRTEEVVWNVQAVIAENGTAKGLATVEFTFDDFGMDKPSVAIVLSVDDTIGLTLDFLGTITSQ